MYTVKNYRSKKDMLADLKAGKTIETYQPGGFFEAKRDGNVCLEGPHYPEPHRWYSSATIKDGIVVTAK